MGKYYVMVSCFVFLFFAAINCSIGGAFLLLTGSDLRQYIGSYNWKTAEGEVIESQVLTGTDSSGKTTYRPAVSYLYYVGDERYSGDRLSFGSSTFSSNGDAQSKIDDYPPRSSIKVRYDPRDPSRSVVERRLSVGLIESLVVATAGFLMYPLWMTASSIVTLWRERDVV